ncbi:MAG: putative haloacid dehalogenase-like hydrolase [Frankiales bacterium]|nr:putative haloacid dehalogenase-like hydrolase [Frankiales bacterium]
MDTESTVLESWQHLYASSGHELDLDRWLSTVGGDVEERYAALAALVGDGFDHDAAHDLRLAHELALVAELPLRDGWAEVLDRALDRGLRLAVVSSSPLWWVGGHLTRLGLQDRFELVVTREDAERAKPHPDLYLVALERLGLAPEQALVVEDSVNGAAAATAAGLDVVVVPNAVTVRQAHVVPSLAPTSLWAHVEGLLAA